MSTDTERTSMEKWQKHITILKKIARAEMNANLEDGHAPHAQAWYKVLNQTNDLHCNATDLGLEAFPEFFAQIVVKGGGGR